MKRAKSIGVITAAVIGLIVILQNTQAVETRFMFMKITMPNAILLGITLLIGISIGILVAVITSGRHDTMKQ